MIIKFIDKKTILLNSYVLSFALFCRAIKKSKIESTPMILFFAILSNINLRIKFDFTELLLRTIDMKLCKIFSFDEHPSA